VFYDLGYRSLMDYAISGLGLTPDVAYNHCTVAKKSQELPEVRKAVSEGVLSVSAARHLAPVLTKENEKELVALGSRLTQSELRREVARRNPEMNEAPEKARYVREDRLALELRVSEELMKKLRRAQDLTSESQRKLCSLEATLEAMVEIFLEKRDPLKKAERAKGRAEKAETNQVASPGLPLEDQRATPQARIIRKASPYRTPVPALLKHQILLRTQGQCTEKTPDGKRCKQTRWLQLHHVRPLSEGGENTLENLTVLCSGHHRTTHRKMKE
jgi:5-methylcytosine-specific restriction endonuclease McrA